MLNKLAQGLAKKALGLDLSSKPRIEFPVTKGGSINANNSPLGHMAPYPYSYSTLQYPLDIQQRSDLGHYMLFYINVLEESGRPGLRGKDNDRFGKGKLDIYATGSATSGGVVTGTTLRSAGEEYTITQAKFGTTGANGQSNHAVSHYPASLLKTKGTREDKGELKKRKIRTGINAHFKRNKRTSDAIVLYMPPQIVANYNSAYKESEVGNLIGSGYLSGKNFASQAQAKLKGNKFGNWSDIANSAVDVAEVAQKTVIPYAKDLAFDFALKTASAAAKGVGLGDLKGGYDKMENRQINNFLESMFSGIGFRKFSYMFKFAPKSPQEAEEVDNIIRMFKFHMLPELPMNDYGRYFKVPSEFDLHYMFRGDENTWLNKISTCVCINCDVNYTPTQYQTMRPIDGRPGAPMSEIDMKLDFMETELITKEKILEGF